jgi:hypothetical protein
MYFQTLTRPRDRYRRWRHIRKPRSASFVSTASCSNTKPETYVLSLNRGLHASVNADDVHGNGLSTAGPQQTATSAERIGAKDEEQSAAHNLDDTVNTSSEERNCRASHAKGLEDLRSIVVHSVDTSHLLADHEHDGQDSSLSVSGNGDHLLPESRSAGIASKPSLSLELGRHLLDLGLDVVGVLGKPMKQPWSVTAFSYQVI